MWKRLLVVAMLGSGCMCTDADKTQATLLKSGFTDIQVGGYAWFGCGDDYTFHTEFTATNPTKMRVSGVVCCGLFKGCAVKF